MIDRPSAYVPPPPPDAPRRATSPWVFVGAGCLVLVLLVLAAAGIGIYKFSQIFNAPVSQQEVVKELGDLPPFPGARFDEVTSRIARATGLVMQGALGGKTVVGAAYRVPANPETTLAWYDGQMANRKYKVIHTRQNSANAAQGQLQHQYFRQGEAVIVMAQPTPQDRTNPGGPPSSLVMVMRIQGIHGTPKGVEAPAAE